MLTPRLVRFLLVGLLNTAVGYGLFALFTWSGFNYPIAIALATAGGVLFNFQSIGRLVFDGAHWSKLGRFIAAYAVIYAANVGGIKLLLGTGINVYLANAVLIVPLALFSYFLQRTFVFKAP